MRKNIAKTLIASLCTAFVLSGAAGLFTAFSSAKASADTTATALPADELLIPSTYKQYLALDAPKDIAVSENFTAIADGNILYLYDETEEIYRKYTHDKHGVDSSKNVITQIQFDQSGNLYFTDDFTSDNLYVLNPKTLAPPTRIDEVACRAFALYGESLYFTNSQGTLYYAALNDTANAQDVITNVSAFCLQGDELYLVRSEFYLHKLHSPTNKLPESEVQSTSVTTLYGSVKSLQVKNNTIAYTTVAGDFYAHPISLGVLSNEHIVHDANGYANINSFGDYIYAVKNQTVRQFNPESKAFTSFEICAKSTQANRLSGATDILQAGEKLYIADNGNHRISVYNTKTNAFETSFHTHLPPSFMSLDGDCLLVANEQTAALYSLRSDTFGTLIASAENFASPIKGVAAVYGNYYIACEGYAYTLTKDGVCEGKEKTAFYPELFTSDIYGNLYTLQNGGILRFTESQFLSPDESGDRLCTCSVSGVKKLAVDYKRDIYALTDTAVHKLGESVVQTDFSSPIVYTDATAVHSFTFSVEENAAYLLMDGNYLIKSARLNLPTVNAIAVQNADERIFSEQSAEIKVVKTAANTLFIEFDLQALQGAENFPYLAYERKMEALTALKMHETDEYNILAVFDNEENKYHTYLVLKEFCEPLLSSEYSQAYEQSKTGYLTNAVSLYKFPYLCELLTVDSLPRGGQVTLIGEIGELDHEYYHIAYLDENSEEKFGYIPKSYAVLFDGSPLISEQSSFGATKSDNDAVWRLAYLLLGFAAVCILTDYLLLRKKKDD